MISIKFTVDNHSLNAVMSTFNKLRMVMSGGIFGMMPALGMMLENQHSRRVRSEKTSPDGAPWKRNIRGTSILYQSGALAGGFKASSTLFTARLGPPGLPYAMIQQAGGTMYGNPYMKFNVNGSKIWAEESEVPARPYMGVSEQNWIEIKQLIERFESRGFGWL